MSEQVQSVPLAAIRLVASLWPREKLCEERVKEFERLFREGESATVPPIVLTDQTKAEGVYALVDGRHRYEAAKRAGMTEIRAEIQAIDGETAYLRAVRSCSKSSVPLTPDEKRRAVDRLMRVNPNYADSFIADVLGVSRQFVYKRRLGTGVPVSDEDDGEGEGRAGGAVSANPATIARRMLNSLRQMDQTRRSWLGAGAADKEMGRALAEAALKIHDAKSSYWLGRYATWLKRAQEEAQMRENADDEGS